MSLLAGPAVFLLIWIGALIAGLRLDFARDRMMQFVGAAELSGVSYAEAWASVHMQPPAFTMLLKFSDGLGAAATGFWLALLLLSTVLGLWLVGDLVWTLTGRLRWSLIAGILAALLPGTLYYSLWVFYTVPTALCLTAIVWGMTRGVVASSTTGWLVAVLGVVPLFLLRSTYVWVVSIAWIAVLMWLAWRRSSTLGRAQRWSISAAAVGAVMIIVGVQLSTWLSFGSVTQSSWGFENAAKAVMTQLPQDQRIAAAHGDSCLEQVLAVGVFQSIDRYPPCAREDVPRSGLPRNPLLDAATWTNGFPNLNTADRLALASQWRTWAGNAVMEHPLAVARIPFPNLETKERGTAIRFLWPSSWYWIIEANVTKGGLLASAWILLFSWVPAGGLLGMVLGLWGSRSAWRRGDSRRLAFRVGTVAVLCISIAYLFLETGENERFRVEIDWLIVALGMVGWIVWLRRRTAVDPSPSV